MSQIIYGISHLYQKMINFDGIDFSEHRSKEVICFS